MEGPSDGSAAGGEPAARADDPGTGAARASSTLAYTVRDEHLVLLFEASLDAVVGMNADGLVIAWNGQAERTFGWTKAEAIGASLGELIVPEDLREAHHSGLEHYLRTGEGPVLNNRIEVPGQTKAGARIPVELTIVPLRSPGETVFFAYLRDITHRRQNEARLKQRALEAQVLWEATEMAAAGDSLDELFQACLTRICKVTGWPVGHIYLPDDPFHPRCLVPSNIWHFESDELRPIATETADCRLAKEEGLPGRIWARGAPVWIADVTDWSDLPRKPSFLGRGLMAAFGFPVYERGRLQAVLEFFSTDRQAPDEHLLYVIQSLGQQLGRVLERQRAQEQQNVLLRELSHRVGNLLSVVQSVFTRSVRHAPNMEALKESFSGRLMSMAEANRLLSHGDWEAAGLDAVVHAAVAPYCRPGTRDCSIEGPEIRLPGAMVMPLTMILHELATNAAKHGAFRDHAGTVAVRWETSGEVAGAPRLVLNWRESGAGGEAPGTRTGYGTVLVDQSVERGLGGTVTRSYDADGFAITISLPLPA